MISVSEHMKKKLTSIIFLILATFVSGQSSDILIWKTDTLNLYLNPLELKSDWNEIDQKISTQIEKQRVKKSKDIETEVILWGNYNTEWLIENDSLYLTKISSSYDNEELTEFENFFLNNENRKYANWVNSSLITFDGQCIVCLRTHHRNTNVYPHEKLLEFKNGVLIGTTDFKNKVLKESKFFAADPNTYQNFIYNNIQWGKLPELSNKHFQVWVSIEPTKNGKLKKIDLKNTYLIDYSNFIDDPENIYIKEAIRITRKIPDWNVIVRHNKILNQGISIVFDEHMKKKYAR